MLFSFCDSIKSRLPELLERLLLSCKGSAVRNLKGYRAYGDSITIYLRNVLVYRKIMYSDLWQVSKNVRFMEVKITFIKLPYYIEF
jgi:hypothetical protein